MSNRSKLNRRRVPFSAARPRRIAPTFPLILTGLLGLSGLRVLPLSPTPPILTDFFDAPRLYAQTPGDFNAFRTPERAANIAQTTRSPQIAATAPRHAAQTQNQAQNQVVFFSIPVAADVAIVRSGPSADAYSTGTVGKNRYVEAYFRSADGWCAIRPPQGSFSWINAKFVRRETDSTGRVVASGGKAIPARVGGATVEESAIVQVGLKNGLAVKILDETRLSDGSTWLKIAPPSGEFRWIRSSDLVDDPALAQLPSQLTFQREFFERLARSSNGATAPNASDASLIAAVDASGSKPSQNAALASDASAQAAQTAQALPFAQTTQSADGAATPVSEEAATQFKMELARLNADVFQTLRQNPPSDAELALLASRAELLFDAAPTDGERFVVQSIYDAIKIAERRNRSRANGGDAPQPNASPAPNGSNGSPNSSVFPNSPVPSESLAPAEGFGTDGANRFGEFELENGAPLLVLPDSNFESSDGARSDASAFVPSDGAPFYPSGPDDGLRLAPNVGPDGRIDVSQFFPPETARSSNAFNANGAAGDVPSEKRPRLAFAFSNANNPFRSRSSSKGKEVKVAPVAPFNGGRATGVSKLPPLLPTQKQLIVPPPNYRGVPLGQNVRDNDRLVAAQKPDSKKSGLRSQEAESDLSTRQNETTAQELTVDSVRWRAVDPTGRVEPNVDADQTVKVADAQIPAQTDDETAPSSSSDASIKVAAATTKASATDAKTGRASRIAATASAKSPQLTGATVAKTKKSAAASKTNRFQPVSSQTNATFDASGVLARLPKAPKGTPQYALTRRIEKNRFEIVSYLETEKGVSLEPYVGRKIGVKGTLGTIQIGEKTQKITTVQTVFAQD